MIIHNPDLGQLWQHGGQILLDGYVMNVVGGILKFSNDVIFEVTVVTVVVIWPEMWLTVPLDIVSLLEWILT